MVRRRPPGSALALSGAPSRTMRKIECHPSRRGEDAAPPAITAEPLRRDEASLTSGCAAHDRLEIIICLDDFDQAIFGRTVAAIGVGMVLLHQRLVFRLDDLEGRIRAQPHHLQRLALGVEYFSGFRLRLVANARARTR